MNQLHIRDACGRDIASIARIEEMSFSAPWSEYSFIEEMLKPHTMLRVAVLNNDVIAYICISQVLDEAHILNLAVHPEYRKRGIAAALVGHILDELKVRACRFIYLEVRASNYGARKLYSEFGFKTTGIRKKYYVYPDEDAVVMMLEI